MPSSRRRASHAGSWYTSSKGKLDAELDHWLEQVPETLEGVGDIPPAGARVIIAPHAGYPYSGPAAAWAYKSLNLSNAKRVFLLGPSHHVYLTGCALSQCDSYETPMGDLQLDKSTISQLKVTGKFDNMSRSTDEDEHSLEMHLPYIFKMLSNHFPDQADFPGLIPILVGNTSPASEKSYGSLLAPYLRDPTSVFVISSDFCHWGSRFSYTYYLPSAPSASPYSLRSSDKPPKDPAIHESIGRLDRMVMDTIESGKYEEYRSCLDRTGNTVCGRHPIGIVMAALEELGSEDAEGAKEGKGKFKFVRYERSGDVYKVSESSVSYASAFAVL